MSDLEDKMNKSLDRMDSILDKMLNIVNKANDADTSNDKALHKHFVSNSEAEFCECDVKDPEIKAMWIVCGNCGKVIKDE